MKPKLRRLKSPNSDTVQKSQAGKIMDKEQILKELERAGNTATKNIFIKHGAKEPIFGVKIADLKKIGKKIKGDQWLALELFDTGNGDAMYLAGLVADGALMTKAQLNKWARKAKWHMISEYTVAWVASESEHGWDLALEWIESENENVASSGWAALASIVATRDDDQIDLKKVKALLKRIGKGIHKQQNRVRYVMNGFVISVAAYITSLHDEAIKIATKYGKVNVEMGGTACKVPFAPEYIEKIKKRGAIGKKRKTAKC